MQCRIATEADVGLLARMNQLAILDEGHRNPMTLQQLHDRMAAFLEHEYQAIVISHDGGDVGYCLYRFDPEWVYLRQFFIYREYRRRGVGRAAMQWLLNHAWKDVRRIRLDVSSQNVAAVEFWRSAGFMDHTLTMELNRDAAPA